MRLNLGCGKGKIEGFINIDSNPANEPDLIHDIMTKLPYANESCEEVVLFHTIEHIPKSHHLNLLDEIHRVLKSDGVFIVSYPEFRKIATNWLNNKSGMRDFWEATIYGRQSGIGDFHVSLMDTDAFKMVLYVAGFHCTNISEEPKEPYNTVIKCRKAPAQSTHEQVVVKDMESILR